MALHLQQTVKQSQKLVLTQELKLGIELLNLTNLELADRIQQELQENPLLEEGTADSDDSPDPGLLSSKQKTDDERSSQLGESDYYAGNDYSSYNSGDEDSKRSFLEGAVSRDESLAEHLEWQLRLVDIDDAIRRLVSILITNLDNKGYLTSRPAELLAPLIQKQEIDPIDDDDVDQAMNILRSLDPIGVGAVNINDCLAIQCEHLRPGDAKVQTILRDHFELLESLDYEKLAKKLDISLDEMLDYARFIGTLDPHPGLLYASNKSNYIQPDIAVIKHGAAHRITYLDGHMPSVEINTYYQSLLKDKNLRARSSKQEREFIQEKLSSAQALLKSISFRQDSLLAVTKAIYSIQQDWFFSGKNTDLKPMTLKDVAALTDISESAISRITSRKYVQTDWGILSLKFFFSSSVTNESGEKDSAKKIMDLIKNLIEAEKPEEPLSDLELEKRLKADGIQVARRTIAKYRNLLKIPNHSMRKKIAKLKNKSTDK